MKRRQPPERRVLQFMQEHGLAGPGRTLVVGVSGGPDSVCLVHMLAGLRRRLGLELHMAHLNHMLRDAESDGDAAYVSALGRELGIPATVERHDVAAHRNRHRLSLEEAAREVRYAFFGEVARSLGAEVVAVGHTADDQVETILMHLVRGTGLAGLRGMQPLTALRQAGGPELRVARPLLDVLRSETESYCAAHGLSPRSDSSNLWPDQLRNRIRSELIPLLRRYNPEVEAALLRTARAARADLACLDDTVSQIWGSVAVEEEGRVSIERDGFSRLHPALKRHLVRMALQRLAGELRDIDSVHVESVVDALAKPAGGRLSLPRGLAFHGDYTHGVLAAGAAPSCPLPPLKGEHRLNVPGETGVGGWKVSAAILETMHAKSPEDAYTAYLDLDVTGDELYVRGRRRGERFQPLGMESPKKLQDFMVDARIPRDWRDRVPLVCSPQQVLWVVGWRIDHRARVTPSTNRVLRLDFSKTEPSR